MQGTKVLAAEGEHYIIQNAAESFRPLPAGKLLFYTVFN
jgi:hypothetical protein